MRIGINGRFLAARVTGVQRFAYEVATRLVASERAALLLPGDVEEGSLPGAEGVRGRLVGHAWEQLELPTMARRAGCDVVLSLANTGPIRGARNVLMVHDVTPLTDPGWYTPAFAAWYRVAMGGAARRAARVLVPSRWTAAELVRVCDVDADRITRVTQGLAPFRAPASDAAVAATLRDRGLRAPYLLAMGGGDPRKNLSFLMDVLRDWPGGSPPVTAVVGDAAPGVHRAAGRPGGNGTMRALGAVSDAELHALYTGATAFCYPSLAEGFGRPPLEAMGCGTPAVVADYEAAEEVLGDAAVRLPLDAERWRGTLREIMADERVRTELAERGRAHAAGFRWEDAARTVADACRAALDAPAAEEA